MTLSTHPVAGDDDQRGILGDAGGLDAAGLGLLPAHTAQVSVVLPRDDDDELLDDEVIADEIGVSEPVVDEDGDDAEPVEAELVETGPVDAPTPSRTAAESAEIQDVELVEADAVDATDPVVTGPVVPVTGSVASTASVPATGPAPATGPVAAPASVTDTGPLRRAAKAAAREAAEAEAARAADPAREPADADAARGAAEAETQHVDAEPAASAPPAVVPPAPVTGPQDTRWARAHPDDPLHEDRVHAVERVNPPREVSLTSRRIDEFEPHRESADLLTADRLLDRQRGPRAEPEGAWQQFVYAVSGGRINLGDGRRARARKDLDRRIATPLVGGAKFVPVLSRKGGVGKTTVTTLLGMALAAARDDRVIAIDANPDRGTLADRFARSSGRTVRDLARRRGQITDFHELSSIVARDDTRLDVLASDDDPRMSEAFSDRDYHDVAAIAAHYYSIVVTDTGTGVVHSVMGATLDLADQIVVVAGLSVDEARLASEMLTWLETNGYSAQVREAVVVLNNSRPGSPLVRRGELEAHFRTRVRAVVNLPYDPLVAAGSAIDFRDLQPATRDAARAIAAEVVGGLAQSASAA